tara:strand:- start:11 stop:1606 length:1596 start_codon:yes stop_codon:yes gene_type:complete
MKRNNTEQFKVIYLGVVILFCFTSNLYAQYIDQYPISASNAKKMVDIGNLQEAVRQYESLLEEEPNNIEYKHLLGKSYSLSYIDRQKGLTLLEEVFASSNRPEGVENDLAIAFFKSYQFAKAKKHFQQLLSKSTSEEDKKKYQNWISQCDRSSKMKEMENYNISFENLGKEVNSNAPDYLPYVSYDESQITFTTRREGVVGNLYDYGGYRTADIYMAKNGNKAYRKARSVGSPNTYGNEQTGGQSENGQYLIYNVNSEEHFNNLFVSEKGKRSYMPPKVFGSDKINTNSDEMGGTLTNDGSRLYFCSNREGGLGGFDIYWTQRLPNGEWGEIKNIGPPINTPKNEQYPLFSDNGETLYFSSDGHLGMGDMDLFKSKWNHESKTWSEPVNLGCPINSVDDDLNISFAGNTRYAYMAKSRDDGFGDLDIYRLTFHEERSEYTLFEGRIMNSDSSMVDTDVLIEIFDLSTEELFGSYLMDKQKGVFHAILSPGKYRIEIINTVGYKDFEQKVTVMGKNYFKPKRSLPIILEQGN